MIYTIGMKILSDDLERTAINDVLALMVASARTAPKGRGVDLLEMFALTGDDLEKIADCMHELGTEKKIAFFVRDALCVRKSSALFLIGIRDEVRNVPFCGFCGCEDCVGNRVKQVPCAIGQADLGIALGSASSIANNFHIDSRIMFSAGVGALKLGLFSTDVKIAYGIPLSVTGKNIFFDRS